MATRQKAELTKFVKVRGPSGDGRTSDAGTYWPPTTTTIGGYETVDWDELLKAIEEFEQSFKNEPPTRD